MINLVNEFANFANADTYQRVDDKHLLDLYLGVDEAFRWTLLLVCDKRPQRVSGSKMIEVKIGKRKDGRWSFSLSLTNTDFRDIFALLCNDIIVSSRSIKNKQKGAEFVVTRYLEWKEMLASTGNGLLPVEKIKGLLGEMYFLETELFPKYGCKKAALSWTGPKAFHQDFIVENTWYEVKTVSSGKTDVNISSVEQLDCENSGTLVVVFADKTSLTNENGISLNKIYARLIKKINDDDVKAEFCNMLLRYGYYPRQEYEDADYTFKIINVWHYRVGPDFPCLRRKQLPAEITKATYQISLPTIEKYREEDENET